MERNKNKNMEIKEIETIVHYVEEAGALVKSVKRSSHDFESATENVGKLERWWEREVRQYEAEIPAHAKGDGTLLNEPSFHRAIGRQIHSAIGELEDEEKYQELKDDVVREKGGS